MAFPPKLRAFLNKRTFLYEKEKEATYYFAGKLANVKTAQELLVIIDEYANGDYRNHTYTTKMLYHFMVGYAIPSTNALEMVSGWMKKILMSKPKTRFVDIGSGSGVWEYLLSELYGIPLSSMLCVDVSEADDDHFSYYSHFVPPDIRNPDYVVDKGDVFWCNWGLGMHTHLQKYIDNGGWCCILLGEGGMGCTSPSGNHFQEEEYEEEWDAVVVKVPGGLLFSDYLSLNTRK